MVAYVPPKQAGKYKAVASGAITNGKPVIVNTDGTVSVPTGGATGTAVVFSTGNGTADGSLDVAFDSSNDKSVIVFLDQSNSNYGTSQVFSPAGTLEDLTPAQTYYVQTDGTLSETADDPSVTAGTAVAGSTLIVKG